ncbi:glycosyltransferase [Thalassoroseus pseudoceratinae]|uniref:glycosyltransferase n=1 Tax=Thalassoroseus pseudoceratinae TaxID=2713176 RepID=UPI0014205C23|nr:glycosyltransferase [Thalassoroseus pseudoceratinae]
MKVSVAICTWNRDSLLEKTLLEMRSLKVPCDVSWELLVVNNNCSDDTDGVVGRLSDELPIRLLHEPKPGQSNARNCAIRKAEGELLIWTDDDVLVDSDWISQYVRAAEAHPEADFFGGTVDPYFEQKPPRWLLNELVYLGSVYALRQLDAKVRPFRGDEIPMGANMAFRTKILRKENFDPRLGNAGNNNLRGDDAELLRRLMVEGYRGLWVGPARVRHFVPRHRMTRRYVWKWFEGSGRSSVLRNGKDNSSRLFGAPRWAFRKLLESGTETILRYPRRDDRWLKAFCNTATMLGVIRQHRADESVSNGNLKQNNSEAR